MSTETPTHVAAPTAPFGSVFAPTMSVSRFDGAAWSPAETVPLESFALHPGTHALHYGSSCFEGLKAHRQPDRSVQAFRADAHVARLRQSAARLCLPVPPAELATELIDLAVGADAELTPGPARARCTCARRCSAPTSRSAPPPRRASRRSCTCWPVRSASTSRPGRSRSPSRRSRRAPPRSSASSRPAPTTPWRCRRSPRPGSAGVPTRCCSRRAARCRRRARRT